MKANLVKIASAALLAAACSDALNPSAERRAPEFATTGGSAISLSQQNGLIGETGTTLAIAFPANPHLGDAVIATFFYYGAPTIINSVTDRLADGTPAGNRYRVVATVTSGPISMVTYV